MEEIFDDKRRPILSVGDVLSNGFAIGLKNAASLIGASILWILTIWIPYLNVGTTIGLFTMPIAMSKGNIVSPLEIFDGKYRQYMGEFFLLLGLRSLMTTPGYMFMVVPGIIMEIAYSMGIYLVLDKHIEPSKALSMSNKMTYGNKMTIFLSKAAIFVGPAILMYILGLIMPSIVMMILALAYVVLLVPVMLGIDAYVYAELSKGEFEE